MGNAVGGRGWDAGRFAFRTLTFWLGSCKKINRVNNVFHKKGHDKSVYTLYTMNTQSVSREGFFPERESIDQKINSCIGTI